MPLAALAATMTGIAGSLALAGGRFALGGILLLVSVLSLRWPDSMWSGSEEAELSAGTRRIALLIVCGLAVFFRVYRLNQPGLWGDDALNGLLAYDILDGEIRSPFEIVGHSHSSFHALSNYPIAAAFWLFGADLTTLRLPGVVLGSLCVPLLYATLAPLFGSPVALLAALFCASSPPQLTHSKELVQIITGQFFQLAGMCLLVRGMAAGRAWMVAAAGLPLAMCIYTYHSARLAPLVAVVYGIGVLWERGRAGRPCRQGGALALALLVFALALIPAIVGYLRDPNALVQRLSATSVWPIVRAQGSLWPLWETASLTLLAFHHQQGPEYHWFGLGFDPAVNVVIGFLVLHGLAESLLRWRESRHLLLLSWCVVGLLPAVLSTGAPRIYRAFLALPPIYVWAALPLCRLFRAADPARAWPRVALRGLAAALVVAVPLIDFNYYFYRLYTHPTFRWFQGERLVEMARTLHDFGPGWTGYLLADTFEAEHESFRFLSRAWGLHIVPVASLTEVLPLHGRPEQGALFMMSHGAQGAAAAIERMYPGHDLIVRREPTPRTWWLDAWWPLAQPPSEPEISAAFYPVSRADAARPQVQPPWGLEAEYQVAGRRVVRHEPYPFYYFLAPTFSRPLEAVWRGRLTVPESGDHDISVSANGLATLWIDGREVGAETRLSPGEHEFMLRLRDVPGSLRLKIFWRRPHTARELVPPSAFAPPSRS